MKSEKCENCMYYNPSINECRRYPPVAIGEYFEFPDVTKSRWCGEYKEGDYKNNK